MPSGDAPAGSPNQGDPPPASVPTADDPKPPTADFSLFNIRSLFRA